MADDSVATIIYTVSATRYRVASFPGTDAVRIAPNRYVPSVKVMLAAGDKTDVMAVPVIAQEIRCVEDAETIRGVLHQKVDTVINELIQALTQGAGS